MQNFEMSSEVVVSGGGDFPAPWLIYEALCLIPRLSRRPYTGSLMSLLVYLGVRWLGFQTSLLLLLLLHQ